MLKCVSLFSSVVAITLNATSSIAGCVHPHKGDWEWGRAPVACELQSDRLANLLSERYPSLVFGEGRFSLEDSKQETTRYITELYSVLRDGSIFYIRNRKPKAKLAEQKAWLRAILTLAHQETYWSHYRSAHQNRLHIMRGDFEHGHGLLQIDDRYHSRALDRGAGVDLGKHLLYAMDLYFEHWQQAPSLRCVRPGKNFWRNRARSAFSAYNGGGQNGCRFTNTGDEWARNDRGFEQKWAAQEFMNFVSKKGMLASIDIACFMKGGEVCLPPGKPVKDLDLLAGRLIQLDSGGVCVYRDGKLKCVTNARDQVCLNTIADFKKVSSAGPPLVSLWKTGSDSASQIPIEREDRHSLCNALGNIFAIGDSVEAMNPLAMRQEPGIGKIVGHLSTGGVAQVLDFQITDFQMEKRYYKIKANTLEGWVFAGNEKSKFNFLVQATTKPLARVLPMAGDRVRIINRAGSALRVGPNQTLLRQLPPDTEFLVKSLELVGDYNQVYLYGEAAGQTGFAYAGRLRPKSTVSNWIKIQ